MSHQHESTNALIHRESASILEHAEKATGPEISAANAEVLKFQHDHPREYSKLIKQVEADNAAHRKHNPNLPEVLFTNSKTEPLMSWVLPVTEKK
jgi:hypothetical protein